MNTAPKLARWLVRATLQPPLADDVIGDLDEEFSRRTAASKRGVRRWYWRMAIGSVAAGFVRSGRWRGLITALDDVRSAFRSLRHRPVLVAACSVVIALGIGSGVAVFTLGNAVFLTAIPGTEASDRVYSMEIRHPDGFRNRISVPTLDDLTRDVPGLSQIVGYNPTGVAVSVDGGPPVSKSAVGIHGDLFGALGVTARVGRLFGSEEWDPARPQPVVVLSESLWAELFASDPEAVGRTLRIADRSYTVIGVVRGFRGTVRGGSSDLWINAGDYFAVRHDTESSVMDRNRAIFFQAIAVLDADAESEAVTRELRSRFASLLDRQPDVAQRLEGYEPTLEPLSGLTEFSRGRAVDVLRILGLGGLFLLLISAANVANLLLLDGAARIREGSVRSALGATRTRIVRERFAESLLLSVPGGALGIAGALLVTPWVAAATVGRVADPGSLGLDPRVAAFSVALLLGAALLFGLAPAALASDTAAAARMKVGAGMGSRWGTRLRFGLSAAQITVSFALLVGALLLTRSVHNLTQVPLGFDAERVWHFGIDPGRANRTAEESEQLARSTLMRLEEDPDVETAALASYIPFSAARGYVPLTTSEPDAPDPVQPITQYVTERYFDVLGLDIRRGRGFTLDELAPPAGTESSIVILSETLARRLFGASDPIGRTVVQPMTAGPIERQVVGVVADARFDGDLTGEVDLAMYLPWNDRSWPNVVGLVRMREASTNFVAGPREVVLRLDDAVPVTAAQALSARVDGATARQRAIALLLFVFSLVSILLSGVGLYAVVAYSIRHRLRELSIRMALGANGARLVRQVLGSGLRVGGVGLVAGVAVAYWTGATIRSQLFGISSGDPATYAVAACGFLGLVLLACALPARRSTRVDPVTHLAEG